MLMHAWEGLWSLGDDVLLYNNYSSYITITMNDELINIYYIELCACNTIYLWTYTYVYPII